MILSAFRTEKKKNIANVNFAIQVLNLISCVNQFRLLNTYVLYIIPLALIFFSCRGRLKILVNSRCIYLALVLYNGNFVILIFIGHSIVMFVSHR